MILPVVAGGVALLLGVSLGDPVTYAVVGTGLGVVALALAVGS